MLKYPVSPKGAREFYQFFLGGGGEGGGKAGTKVPLKYKNFFSGWIFFLSLGSKLTQVAAYITTIVSIEKKKKTKQNIWTHNFLTKTKDELHIESIQLKELKQKHILYHQMSDQHRAAFLKCWNHHWNVWSLLKNVSLFFEKLGQWRRYNFYR